jgi:DNA-binding NtrC family response regulator
MMPKGGGMDLYDRLGRERPALRDKMVFMTGGTFTEPATHFLKTVPNPRLMKPFAIDDLLAIVERAPAR